MANGKTVKNCNCILSLQTNIIIQIQCLCLRILIGGKFSKKYSVN